MPGRRARYLVGLAALVATYFVLGWLGLALPNAGTNVTLVWAPAGIALAVLVRWGLRFWPGVWAGAFLIGISMGTPAWIAGLVASGNTLGAITGCLLLRYVGDFRSSFERHRDVALFVLFGAALSTMVSATLGTGALSLADNVSGAGLGSIWVSWWLGDAAGVLLAAPLVLLWDAQVLARLNQEGRLGVFFGTLTAVVAVVALTVKETVSGRFSFAVDFLPILLLWWVMLRFRAWESACSVFVFMAVMIVSTAIGLGPFITDDPWTGQEALWGFLATTSLVVLLRASLQGERDRIAWEHERFFESSLDLLCIADCNGHLTRINPAMERILGFGRDELLGRRYLEFFHPEDRPAAIGHSERLDRGQDVTNFESRLICKDGTSRTILWNVSAPQPGEDVLHGVGRDVTGQRRAEETIRQIIAGIETETGEDFFHALAGHLCRTCQVKFAAIGQLEPSNPDQVQTIALSHKGERADNIRYNLRGTPCESVLQQSLCHYSSSVQRDFPHDEWLVEMEIDAYMGIPLVASDGQILGLIALTHDRPLAAPGQAQAILQVVAARAGAELERKRAEDALKNSERRFRSMFEQAGVAVALFESQSCRFVRVNDKCVRLLGYPAEELIGRTWMSVTHPNDLQEGLDKTAPLAGGVILEFTREKRLIHKDGSPVWVNLTVSPVWTSGEAPSQHVAIVEDITARKQAERKLHEAQERLELAVQGTSDGLWDWDMATNTVWISARGMELLGHAPQERTASGGVWAELIHPDDLKELQQATERHQTEHRPFDVEHRMRHADGQFRWFRSRAQSVRDAEGKSVRMSGSLQDVTDQRKSREALLHSQCESERLRNQLTDAIESIPDGFALYDANDRLVLCNRRYREIYDVSEDLLVPGATFEDHVRSSAYRGQVREAVGREEEWVRERVAQHQNPSGTYLQQLGNDRWLRISECKTRAGGIVGVRTDITERKQLEIDRESQLQHLQSMDRINRLIVGAQDPEELLDTVVRELLTIFACDRARLMYPCDPSAQFVQVKFEHARPEYSSSRPRGFRLPVDETTRDTMHMLLAADQPMAIHGAQVRQVINPEVVEQFQIRSLLFTPVIPRVGLPWILSLHQCSHARVWTGQEQRLFGAIRRRLEDALSSLLIFRELRESERQLQFTQFSVDHSLTEIYRIDVEGRFRYVNEAACESLGYSREELLQLRVPDINPNTSADDWPSVWQTARTEKALRWQATHQRKDGSVYPIDLMISFLKYEDSEFLVVFVQDATERKQANERLERQNAELAHVARLSTMGQMVAMLSHELAQPLAAISNDSDICRVLLERGQSADPRLRQSVDRIVQQVERSGGILGQVRDFVRNIKPHKSTWDVNQLIRDTLKLIGSDLRYHSVTTQTQLPDEPLSVSMDRVQIQQVIVNLLTNARDAMLGVDASERRIDVRSFRQNGRAVFEIADSGCGLSPEIRDRLFEPFMTTKESGMGIGLSICQSIVTAHSGEISAASNRNKGAVFRVCLPVLHEGGEDPSA